MATPSFFEGPEKKVELVVTPGFPPLRSLGEEAWQRVIEAAGAKAISVLRNAHCDAYLLSESSLFIYDDYLVMITCGQTTLVDAVEEILTFVPAESIALLVYERKNEHFPDRQPTSFYDDARQLQTVLPGRALRFGDEHGHYVQMFHTVRPYTPEKNDPTLEVLMHAIDEGVAERFAVAQPSGRAAMSVALGIEAILPGFTTSEYVFSPVGYSLNALKGEEYYTFHVTPEETGSYVSFETNCDFRDELNGLVGAIVELFKPRAFDVVTFLPEGEPTLSLGGYQLGDHVVHDLGGYRVSYFQYFVPPTGPRQASEVVL